MNKRSSKFILPIFLAVISLIFCFSLKSYSQIPPEGKERLVKSIKLMDAQQADLAIVILDGLVKELPNNFYYNYELAYAHYLKKDYAGCIAILEQFRDSAETQDIFFRLLGNSYAIQNIPDKAYEVYHAGLIKFPNSGKLYTELGIMFIKKNQLKDAVVTFETGTQVEPKFASNYYWLSKLWLRTSEKLWGMMYGEIFMNIERNTQRTNEISGLLFKTYKEQIKIEGDNKISISFSKENGIKAGETNRDKILPYGTGTYERHLLTSLSGLKEININTLTTVRAGFLKNYFDSKSATVYPNSLFNYQKQILDAGHMDAYSHWVLQHGDPESFELWLSGNKEKFEEFLNWFATNKLSMSETNKFSIASFI